MTRLLLGLTVLDGFVRVSGGLPWGYLVTTAVGIVFGLSWFSDVLTGRFRTVPLALFMAVLFLDRSPYVFQADDPFSVSELSAFHSIYTEQVFGLGVIHLFSAGIFVLVVQNVLLSKKLAYSKAMALMGFLLMWLVPPALANVSEDQLALRFGISDVAPYVTFLIYYPAVRQYLKRNPKAAFRWFEVFLLLMQARALSYLVQYGYLYAIEGGFFETRFAWDTTQVVNIIIALMMPMLSGGHSLSYRFLSLLSGAGAALMFVGQPERASFVLTVAAALVGVGISFTTRSHLKLARPWSIALYGASVVLALVILPINASSFVYKLSKIPLSIEAAQEKEPVRYAELVNVVHELSRGGAVTWAAGKGAGSYFEFQSIAAPPIIYTQVGAYTATELATGRFYFPHGFLIRLLLKAGIVGLGVYVAAFVSLWLRGLETFLGYPARVGRAVGFVILLVAPSLMYLMYWSSKAALICAALWALLDHMRGRALGAYRLSVASRLPLGGQG